MNSKIGYAGAHTYRWSGGNKLNLQNLPRGGNLRRAILAPPDFKIAVCDLSQIEARFTVWFCGQKDVVRNFSAADEGTGASVYRIMAAKIYDKSPEQITKDERFIGKICVLGLGFGMGWKKLQATLALGSWGPAIYITDQEALYIVNTYRNANIYIVRMWDRLGMLLEHMATKRNLSHTIGPVTFKYQQIILPSGLALRYPGMIFDGENVSYMSRYGRNTIWGGAVLENIVQALARCHIAESILKISEKYFVASMTHDETISLVPSNSAEESYKEIESMMVVRPEWASDLPIAAEGGYARNYSK